MLAKLNSVSFSEILQFTLKYPVLQNQNLSRPSRQKLTLNRFNFFILCFIILFRNCDPSLRLKFADILTNFGNFEQNVRDYSSKLLLKTIRVPLKI